jgi:hypothetical protein
MIIRSLTDSLDWTFGNGIQDFLFAEAAIEENIQTRLMSFLNDCFFAMQFGVDWWNLIGARNPIAQQQIIIQTRQMIIQSFGVVRINSVNATFNANTRALQVDYNIDTVYTRNVTGSVTPGQ